MTAASRAREAWILIVDDDPDITTYLASLLEDSGYAVGTCASTTAALRAMDARCPDVVLVDVLMPGRSGLDFLVQVRRDPRWSRVALVLMTGMDAILQEDCHSYLGSHGDVRGPDAVLGKPIDVAVLRRILQKLLGEAPPP